MNFLLTTLLGMAVVTLGRQISDTFTGGYLSMGAFMVIMSLIRTTGAKDDKKDSV